MRVPLFAKLLVVVLALGTVAMLSSGWKEMQRSRRIESEVDSLRQEAERIRNENRTIEEKIAYYSTEPFQEREAKEKLDMKKGDEEVVSVDTGSVLGSETSDGSGVRDDGDRLSDSTPNYRKWFAYFGVADRPFR
ncbi:MAG: cell division protein FtsL [Candidatus Moranbacteria bacterium]|nr:cell division protein FtsL [Candidatus Moranbacteria bacterium]